MVAGAGVVAAWVGIFIAGGVGLFFRIAAGFGVAGFLVVARWWDLLYGQALRVFVGSLLLVVFALGGWLASVVVALAFGGFVICGLSLFCVAALGLVVASPRLGLVSCGVWLGVPGLFLSLVSMGVFARLRCVARLSSGRAGWLGV
ncbi:hypothetical protein SAMN03159496_04686 [Rhizobium sp. NFR07]|uniref:hypothetical protein n=1 Tax=Rhizobium sp. NFR07 TaxID=1566262 RepID=UPI0008E540B1|nr:hypothetical protein [Rhizobium sp. NFR07]SFB52721.1 hypothetical protein SAMN03159496_04686 [Rhizobium sp. NFR07]